MAALLALSGCASAPEEKPVDQTGKPGLSEAAIRALVVAEVEVEQARAAHALWTTADSALKTARKAADVGDSAEVLRQTEMVTRLVRLGFEQTRYPSTEPK
ncbi:MAG: hypothetical protein MUC79_09440 [Thiobacillaceae bacterium]|jgi:hypothetical protein|nr:hypothetical protein [Thiobacillaceae bacterium]